MNLGYEGFIRFLDHSDIGGDTLHFFCALGVAAGDADRVDVHRGFVVTQSSSLGPLFSTSQQLPGPEWAEPAEPAEGRVEGFPNEAGGPPGVGRGWEDVLNDLGLTDDQLGFR